MNIPNDTVLLMGTVGDRETDARVTFSSDTAPIVAIAQLTHAHQGAYGHDDLVDMVTLTVEQMDTLTQAWLAWRTANGGHV